MAAHGSRTGVLDATDRLRYKGSDADNVRHRADDWRNISLGDKRKHCLQAFCPRWGVACTSADGGRRAIFHATAARRPLTSSDDKLR